MTISILLVDDNAIFREGVRTFLEAQEDFKVVGEAGSGVAALQLAAQLAPDVVLLDWQMPGLSGMAVLNLLAKVSSGTRIIILSMHAEDDYVVSARQHGAAGYVLKDDIVDHLPKALRAVKEGEQYFHISALSLNDIIKLPGGSLCS